MVSYYDGYKFRNKKNKIEAISLPKKIHPMPRRPKTNLPILYLL